MRFPIRVQLMLATLLVAVTAIVLACAASIYLAVSVAARTKAEELSRIEETLSETNYPLTESVLGQMRGYSGAEFVLLDAQRRVVFATIDLGVEDRALLKFEPTRQAIESLAEAAEIKLSGRAYFGHVVPAVREASSSVGHQLVVLYGKDQWWAVARQVALPIVGAGLVAIVLAVGLTTLIAGWLVLPIEALKAQSEKIAAGQFEPVSLTRRNDELADLAISINRMTERLQQYEVEVRQAEQLRTLDQLGAGMAHTLRNTATGARLAIEIFQRKNPQASSSESLGMALQQLELMETFIQKFLRLGQQTSNVRAELDLADVIDGALPLVRPAFDHAHVRLETHVGSESILVEGDPESLRELILNLLLNALEATGASGGDAFVVLAVDSSEDGAVEIRVADSGPGPAPETSERMFEPFVSEKPEGTGLGLHLARQIAEAHGGSIHWERKDGLTVFVVSIPRQADK
jgi:signal transduction histidine kinase